jgi:hypothetical protein
MRGAIPPLLSTPSWRGAQLKFEGTTLPLPLPLPLPFTFTFTSIRGISVYVASFRNWLSVCSFESNC